MIQTIIFDFVGVIVDSGGLLTPEAYEVFEQMAPKYHLYINSGTPEEALRETVHALGIEGFFDGVFGYHAEYGDVITSKFENGKKIFAAENIAAKEAAFVGDGEADRAAAERLGCFFIGMANQHNGWRKMPFPLAENLRDVRALIEEKKQERGKM